MTHVRNSKQKNVAVLFGGCSAEHEISIITALQAIQALDPFRYKAIPVYVTQDGKWYTGLPLLEKTFYKGLPESLSQVQEVTLLPNPSLQGLLPYSQKSVSETKIIPIDLCFLAFHGQQGEDGCVQGLLELADLPYTGCNVTTSALAMHKHFCKAFLETQGIPVLPGKLVRREQVIHDLNGLCAQICATPGLEVFPLFIKPCTLGSSIGIGKANDRKALGIALAKAFQYDNEVLIEPYIAEKMEINVAVLDGDPPIASVVEIPLSSGGTALSYEDKYLRGGNKSGDSSREGMASLTRVIDPPYLDSSIKKEVSSCALKAFSLLGCSGVGRFDFLYDLKRERLYFNELNPLPGSLAFYLWEKSHPQMLYTELLTRLLERAEWRKSQQRAVQRNVGFRALI